MLTCSVCSESGDYIHDDYLVHSRETNEVITEETNYHRIRGKKGYQTVQMPQTDPYSMRDREKTYLRERIWCYNCCYVFPIDPFHERAKEELDVIRARYLKGDPPKSSHEIMTNVHTKILVELMTRVLKLEADTSSGSLAPTISPLSPKAEVAEDDEEDDPFDNGY